MATLEKDRTKRRHRTEDEIRFTTENYHRLDKAKLMEETGLSSAQIYNIVSQSRKYLDEKIASESNPAAKQKYVDFKTTYFGASVSKNDVELVIEEMLEDE